MVTSFNSATQQVYFRRSWTAQWELRRDIWCERVQFAVAPQIGTGKFELRYGVGMLPDETNFAIVSPLFDAQLTELDQLKVVMTFPGGGTVAWYGVVGSQDAMPDGTLQTNLGPAPKGVQYFTAHELTWLLTREPIRTAWIEVEGGEAQIGRGLTFNERVSDGPFGGLGLSRSTGNGPRGVPIFAKDPWDARAWSAWDIIDHVMAYHVPKGDNPNAPTIPAFFRSPSDLEPLKALAPTVDSDNKSVWEILTQILDRRRLLAIWCNAGDDGIGLELVRFNEDPITLYSADGQALILPANPNQIAVDLRARQDASAYTVLAESQKVSQVVVRGARRTGTFTVSKMDDTLEEDWLPADETEYDAAASNQSGYATMKWSEKRQANDLVRRRDKLQRVYSWFRVPATWDGKAGNGEGGGAKRPVFPVLDQNTGNPTTTTTNYWRRDLRFDHETPLFTDADYAADDPGEVDAEPPVGSSPERMRPFCLVQIAPDQWQYFDKLARSQEFDQLTANGARYSGNLRVRKDALGLQVELSGAPKYKLAKDSFTPLADVDEEPDYNWKTDLLFTATAVCDEHVEIRLPPNPAVGDVARRKYLDVPEARLDYLAPNTVVGIDAAGALERTPAGGFLRDDRWLLRNVAEVAWRWYSVSRRSATITTKMRSQLAYPGTLILTLDQNIPLGTVVTSIDFDFSRQAVVYATNFVDFAVESLASEGLPRTA